MVAFDPHYYPNASRRTCTYASRGMVATSQPLAAQAGLDILKRGGNAVDAAIATAISLTVLEPTSNGIGGDLYALVWMGGQLHGLNGSGTAPQALAIDAVKARGYEAMPMYGIVPLTVPGAPAAWVELSCRFGKLPFAALFEPAIEYAERGFPVSVTLGALYEYEFTKFNKMQKGPEFEHLYTTFAPDGRYPRTGDYIRYPDHAATLRKIAETRSEAFYRGELAERIDAYIREKGGFLTAADLAGYKPEWVEPIKVNYKGYDIWEIPPNGQGIVALMALNMLKRLPVTGRDDVEQYHRQIEAMKLAFTDGFEHVTDAPSMRVSTDSLLADAYAEERASTIGDMALEPKPGQPPKGGTVYVAAADGDGGMVSLIQSNYMGFGSGVVIPGTGIAMQNRAADFSLDAEKANALVAGKKSYHTIIPGFMTKDGEAVGPFGVMGGFMQPQGHVQLVMNTIDFHLNPQAALDAPRWQWKLGKTVELEPGFPDHIAQALQRKGHQIVRNPSSLSFGRGQIIWRDPVSGVLMGGTEQRTDGHIAAW
ncbi:gamma-glutamyltransferase family protein [Paenibacillus cremeus]|uniref:Gamma-glutamyltransferase family protein n=1 Tax=Paenibacillus cremeus TaxID=2163881 RepID=A0A559K8W9_9BACL|nr:gamma-glutamyltransferase family protein [Paenibacillus cremeus]TVY08574.1 gamma-glutamyltransferase family protein [Paenibacillus cremeus]